MKIKLDGNKLIITQLLELGAANSTSFMDSIRENFNAAASVIEVDLSSMQFIDSCGLGTLCSLHRITRSHGIRLRLLHPRPAIKQLLELTQLDEFFEIDVPAHLPTGSVISAIHRSATVVNPEPPPCPGSDLLKPHVNGGREKERG
jgi:anti-anti-sigma factor